MNKQAAVIMPCAGQGTRLGSKVAKQFLTVSGKPVLAYTLDRLEAHPFIEKIILVVPKGWEQQVRDEIVQGHGYQKVLAVITGGDTRQLSVANGLEALGDWSGPVLVHDGVRPLVTAEVIDRVIAGVMEFGSGVAALPLTDTLKEADEDGWVRTTLSRLDLWHIQTPQGFWFKDLNQAYQQAALDGISGTDDASLVEAFGQPVHLVRGDAWNIKITYPEDISLMEARLSQLSHQDSQKIARPTMMRIGFGYDVHQLVADRPLVIGGVELPWDRGLLGHSDADVLLHAVMDALLGAAALGDIGQHFPDTDPRYYNISSLQLLASTRDVIKEAGYACYNLDCTLVAEAPKINPYIQAMQQKISETLQINQQQISIKATTNEAMGFVGRQEGIAAYAVCTLMPL